jgi:hypothetical protein
MDIPVLDPESGDPNHPVNLYVAKIGEAGFECYGATKTL